MRHHAQAASPLLMPTDMILLRAAHLAPQRWRFRRLALVTHFRALLLLLAALAAVSVGLYFSTPAIILVGSLVGAIALAPYAWLHVAQQKLEWQERIDTTKLEVLLIAEAFLANECAGLVRLVETKDGLYAEPMDTPMPWPPGTLEAAMIRGRSMRVSRVVADWRGGLEDPLTSIIAAAHQRGVLQEVSTRHGPELMATASADVKSERRRPSSLGETCATDRGPLWCNLIAAIEEGLLLSPTSAPNPRPPTDPRAEAGVDRFGVPLDSMSAPTSSTAFLAGALVVAGAIAVARLSGTAFGPYSIVGWHAWPLILATAAAIWIFFAARQTWPDDPPPPKGSPGEEEALAIRRHRRLSRPDVRPPLLIRLMAACAMAVLGYVLTLIVTPLGIAALALGFGLVFWRSRNWYRVQQLMPSEREVELAVARRSRELSAGLPSSTPVAERVKAGCATAGSRKVPQRAVRWFSPDDLPPPGTAALAATDRRRRLASAAIRRHLIALLLLVVGLGAIFAVLAWAGQTPPDLILIYGLACLLCIVTVPGRLLEAVHATRSTAWKAAPGSTARLLRGIAAVLPSSGTSRLAHTARSLRRSLVEEPDFRRDDTLNLLAPLGPGPRILAIVAAILNFLLLTFGLLGTNQHLVYAGTAGLAVVAGYLLYVRRHGQGSAILTQPGFRLVLLRVFGSPSFDDLLELVRPWLLCGPVAHLEGFDSVGRSAEAREALAVAHIDGVLVQSQNDLARRLAALPAFPDDNGRYRRQAFQCTDASWRAAIRALLDRGDAVLMDLSDLGPSDMGCAYELGLLLDQVPLSRVLLLIDATTDLVCLRRLLDEAERRIAPDSPNRNNAAEWRLVRIGGSSALAPDEDQHAWLRRIDRRLVPLSLVHFLLEELCSSNAGADPEDF